MAEPLASPGEVIKQLRGSDKEHLAAAGPVPKANVAALASREANPDLAGPSWKKPKTARRCRERSARKRMKRSSGKRPRYASVKMQHVAPSKRSGRDWMQRVRRRSTPMMRSSQNGEAANRKLAVIRGAVAVKTSSAPLFKPQRRQSDAPMRARRKGDDGRIGWGRHFALGWKWLQHPHRDSLVEPAPRSFVLPITARRKL